MGAGARAGVLVVSTLFLVIRPVAEHLFRRGAGFNVHQSTIDTKASEGCTSAAHHQNTVEFVTHIIPDDVSAFATLECLSD